MKVRSDFVTNSSSSSFGVLSIDCKPLAEMIENYEKLMKEKGLGEFPLNWGPRFDAGEGVIVWDWDEDSYCSVPESLSQVLACFCEGLVECGEGYEEAAPIAPLVRAIVENRESLEAAIERVSWSSTNQGWGGDSDNRFNQFVYSKEMLRSIKERIADEKGCTIDEVTEYDFNVAVSSETSLDTLTFEYDRTKGIERLDRDFSFL